MINLVEPYTKQAGLDWREHNVFNNNQINDYIFMQFNFNFLVSIEVSYFFGLS